MYNRTKYCKGCINEIQARRYLEKRREDNPKIYEECSNDSCNAIWKLNKWRTVQKTKGLKKEDLLRMGHKVINADIYLKENCPKCSSVPIEFYDKLPEFEHEVAYEPKFLMHCKTAMAEKREFIDLIESTILDLDNLKKEYKIVSGGIRYKTKKK